MKKSVIHFFTMSALIITTSAFAETSASSAGDGPGNSSDNSQIIKIQNRTREGLLDLEFPDQAPSRPLRFDYGKAFTLNEKGELLLNRSGKTLVLGNLSSNRDEVQVRSDIAIHVSEPKTKHSLDAVNELAIIGLGYEWHCYYAFRVSITARQSGEELVHFDYESDHFLCNDEGDDRTLRFDPRVPVKKVKETSSAVNNSVSSDVSESQAGLAQ